MPKRSNKQSPTTTTMDLDVDNIVSATTDTIVQDADNVVVEAVVQDNANVVVETTNDVEQVVGAETIHDILKNLALQEQKKTDDEPPAEEDAEITNKSTAEDAESTSVFNTRTFWQKFYPVGWR